MTHNDEFPIDRAQEDRTVEYLRANGVFGVRSRVAVNEQSAAPNRRPNKWRVPVIAAAAAVLITFISVLVDVASEPTADSTEQSTSTPRLLIWY